MDEKQNFHGYITLPVLTGAGRLLGPLAGATLSAWKHSAAAAAANGSLCLCVCSLSPSRGFHLDFWDKFLLLFSLRFTWPEE
jgi:hypothetical protein